jgi:predicted MFS family arabinose efflux permease
VFWGPVSDRLGRRLVLSGGVAATGVLTMAMAAVGSFGAALALVPVQGFAAASFSPGALAYLSERLAHGRQAVGIAIVTSSFFASSFVGQAASQAIEGLAGWRAVFLCSGVAFIAVAPWLAAVVEPTAAGHRGGDLRSSVAAASRLLRNPSLRRAIAASVAILGSTVGIYSGLQLMGPGDLHGDGDSLLWLRASGLLALAAVPVIARRLHHTDPARRASGALATAGAALLTLIVVGDSPLAIGAVLLVFVGAIGSTSPAIAQVVGRESGAARGAGMGLWGFFIMLGASAGPQLAASLRPAGFHVLAAVLAGVLGLAALAVRGDGAPAAFDQVK